MSILDDLNDRLNDYATPVTADGVVQGDQILIGSEWITVTRVDHGVDGTGRVRIAGTLGDWADPGDVVTLRIRAEAALRRAAR